MIVNVAVRVPRRLTEEQRALVQQLAESLGDSVDDPDGDSLFSRIKGAFTAS